jgi:hypothetical protein
MMAVASKLRPVNTIEQAGSDMAMRELWIESAQMVGLPEQA